MSTIPVTPTSLHRRALDLDGEALLLRAAGERARAADANIKAQVLRELADQVAKDQPVQLSSRGLPMVHRRESGGQLALLAFAFLLILATLAYGMMGA